MRSVLSVTRVFLSFLAALGLAGCSGADAVPTRITVETQHPRYQAGQVWSYKTRPGEEVSRLTVLQVDRTESTGFIVHIAVDGVSIPNSSAPNGVSTTISHMPFDVAAIDASVVAVESTRPVPDFSEGYQPWREAFDRHQGGVWTVSVTEAVDAMQTAMTSGR